MTKSAILLLLFIFVSVGDLIAISLSMDGLRYVFKPLILLFLFFYYLTKKNTFNRIYFIGLLFSFIGDIFLLGEGKVAFISGLGAFLFAHVFYSIMLVPKIQKPSMSHILFSGAIYGLIIGNLLYLLQDSLGEMQMPVTIYALVIGVFGTLSYIYFLQQRTKNSLLLVCAVMVFMISDAIIALDTFYLKQENLGLSVMLTYVIAQFLILKFVLLEELPKERIKSQNTLKHSS